VKQALTARACASDDAAESHAFHALREAVHMTRRNTKSIMPGSTLEQIIPPSVQGRQSRSSFIRFRLDTPRPFDAGALLPGLVKAPERTALQLRRRTHLK